MPDCFGANAIITQARAIDDHTFAVTIDGHDNGGHGCHAGFMAHFEGRVIIDGTHQELTPRFVTTSLALANQRTSDRRIATRDPDRFHRERPRARPGNERSFEINACS